MQDTYETVEHLDAPSFKNWLELHHDVVDGIWLRIYKKASGVTSITYAEALDAALCYGWIDGLKRSYDEQSYVQKFTPRRTRSMWSKRNVEHVHRLIREGLMQPSGLREIDAAKTDGRWEMAYDGSANMQLPASFLDELEKHPVAKLAFDSLNKSQKYAIGFQLQTARTEKTVVTRQLKIIDLLESGQF